MDIETVYAQFPEESDCIAYLEGLRWGQRPRCPYCKRRSSTPIKKTNRHHCNVCNWGFSVTVGTLFHGTRIPLQKWFLSIALMMSVEKDPTARRLADLIQLNKNTAMSLTRRIRDARVRDFVFLRQLADRLEEKL